jgi:hypothetical protein
MDHDSSFGSRKDLVRATLEHANERASAAAPEGIGAITGELA